MITDYLRCFFMSCLASACCVWVVLQSCFLTSFRNPNQKFKGHFCCVSEWKVALAVLNLPLRTVSHPEWQQCESSLATGEECFVKIICKQSSVFTFDQSDKSAKGASLTSPEYCAGQRVLNDVAACLFPAASSSLQPSPQAG